MNLFKTLWKVLNDSNSCGGDCEQGRYPCNCIEAKNTESLDWPPEKNSVYQNGGLEGNNH